MYGHIHFPKSKKQNNNMQKTNNTVQSTDAAMNEPATLMQQTPETADQARQATMLPLQSPHTPPLGPWTPKKTPETQGTPQKERIFVRASPAQHVKTPAKTFAAVSRLEFDVPASVTGDTPLTKKENEGTPNRKRIAEDALTMFASPSKKWEYDAHKGDLNTMFKRAKITPTELRAQGKHISDDPQ